MALETVTFVQDLVPANPPGTDAVLQGDDHLRIIKTALDNTFPNASRAFYAPRALAKSANYTVLAADMLTHLFADATAAAFTLTLPTLGAGDDGWEITIQKIDSSTNAVIIAGTINGVVNLSLGLRWMVARIWWNGTAWQGIAIQPGTNNFLHIRDEKAAGTDGGPFTSGAWRTRNLNVEMTNEINGASLAADTITLPAGTYHIEARAPAFEVNRHQIRLRNMTDASTTLVGSCALSNDTSPSQTDSFLSGRFTITAEKEFEVQHQCTTTKADNGFGMEANFGEVEIFTEVRIWRLA